MKTFFNQPPYRKIFSAFSLMMVLIALQLTPTKAQEIITVQNGNTIDAKNATQVFVYNIKGMNINVKGVEGHELTYKVFIKANENAMLKNFGGGRLYNKMNDGVLELYFETSEESNSNNQQNQSWIKSFLSSGVTYESVIKEAVLTLEVPKELFFKVNARYSNVNASDFDKNVELKTRSGNIELNRVNGEVLIFNDYGNTKGSDLKSHVTINSRSSETELTNVGGMVKIESDYSDVRLEKVAGSVSVENKSGKVVASDLERDFDHRGNYSSIKLKNVKGVATIDNTNGSLDAENIGSLSFKGNYSDASVENITMSRLVTIESKSSSLKLKNVVAPVSIDGSYMKIKVQKVTGDVKVYNKNGSVDLDEIKGNVRIDGDYNDVELKNIDAKLVEAFNRNGSIRAELLGNPESVSFRNRYGSVNLKMKNEYIGKTSLEVSYGSIKHPFDAASVTREIKNTNDHMIELNGKGKTEIQIRVENGSITIE